MGDQYAASLQRHRLEAKLKIVKVFGGKCVGCGERNPLVLTLNHIYGYNKPNPKQGSRGGWPLYLKILAGRESTDKYDLRCYNCQMLYEFERGKVFSKIHGEVRSVLDGLGIRLVFAGTRSQQVGLGTGTVSRQSRSSGSSSTRRNPC